MLVVLLLLSQADDPFRVGVWVGADPHAWGDLRGMGDDSAATIDAICADLASMGCNSVWVSGFAPSFAERPLMRAWLDAAQKHGLRAVLQGSGFPYAIPKGEADVLARTRAEVVPFWEEVARELRDHPALLAYSPVEEIGDDVENGHNETLRALDAVGRAVAAVDSDPPVVTIHIAAWIAVAREEARLRGANLRTLVADLYVFTDVHDWSDPNSSWKTPEEATRGFLEWTGRHAALAAESGVPLWMFGQANETKWVRRIDGELVTRNNFRMPGEAEMRFQVWASLLAGARGLFLFPYTSTPPPPEETQRELEEWEYGVGMRTLDGKPTASHAGLAAALAPLKGDWALLGRLRPDGEAIEEGAFVGRAFRDAEGRRHAIVLNRDLKNAGRPPAALMERLGATFDGELAPGGGARVEAR